MKINSFIRKLILAGSIFFVSFSNALTCSKDLIIAEVTKFHGPEWKSLLMKTACNESNIRSHLKSIIQSPDAELSAYDQGAKQFIYRNALKSFGHFGTSNEDLNFISKIYNDNSGRLQKLFGENANLFRSTILEAMANTGNIEALDFFQKILENDNNVLYLQQSAADFAFWILEGSPFDENQQLGGSRIYAEIYYPNLRTSAEERFKGNEQALDALREKKLNLALHLKDMINRKEYFKEIMPSLEKLLSSLENKKQRTPQSVQPSVVSNDDHNNPENGNKHNLSSFQTDHHDTKNNSSTKRVPASENDFENQDSQISFNFYLKLIIFIIFVVFVFYFTRKSRWQK